MRIKFRGEALSGGCAFAVILLWVIAAIGWIKNIINFIGCDFAAGGSYKAEILHGIGIVCPPLGAIFGWCNFGK